jgi:hypothetical protein
MGSVIFDTDQQQQQQQPAQVKKGIRIRFTIGVVCM